MSVSMAEKLVANCQLHSVLKVTLRGDTLLITPQGDIAGFQPTFYESEFSKINKMLESGDFKKAIVDLSRAQYFSSAMIGAFMTLKKSVGADGQFVLAEPSPDMMKILQSMHFDTVIPIYDSVELAVKEIANETTWDRIKPKPIVLYSSICVICLLAVILVVTQTNWLSPLLGTQEAQEYALNLKIVEEINAERSAGTFEQNWEKIRETLEPRLKENVQSFYRAQYGTIAKDAVHDATVSLWQLSRAHSVPDDKRLQEVFVLMQHAAQVIQEEQRIQLKVVKLEGYDDTHLLTVKSAESLDPAVQTTSAEETESTRP